MDREAFINLENWYGTYYELCIELGPTGDDARVAAALRALWSHPALQGPWRDRASHESSPEVEFGDLPVLYGVAKIHEGCEIGCISNIVREESGSDWLDFSLPTGMLERIFELQYPLSTEANPWMPRVNEFLASVGKAVFRQVPFELAVIGEETSGIVSASTVTPNECYGKTMLLSEALWNHLKPNVPSVPAEQGLVAIGRK